MYSQINGRRRMIAGGLLTFVLFALFFAPIRADVSNPEPPIPIVGPQQATTSDSTTVDTTMSAGQTVDPEATSVFWLIAYLITTTF